jgi:hypothetical protein
MGRYALCKRDQNMTLALKSPTVALRESCLVGCYGSALGGAARTAIQHGLKACGSRAQHLPRPPANSASRRLFAAERECPHSRPGTQS